MEFLIAAGATFLGCFIVVPILFGIMRLLGFYAIVNEGTCRVYVLFGTVIGILNESGMHILPVQLGWRAFFVNWMGQCHVLDMRLDQAYLRSQPVNSEEGAPMGIGIWYEMFISDPVSYLFKNVDPRGSLEANVSNASVRCLSNMKLGDMLETRHQMSMIVRTDVSEKSHDWGYKLGSVYIRKVHFRDTGMIQQIEAKVVNRLRQVTSSILQDGKNQVSVIASTAEREAAAEFAKAAAMRPKIVGAALHEISQDPEIESAMFEVLENQRMIDGDARITLVPEKGLMLNELLAGQMAGRNSPDTPPSLPDALRAVAQAKTPPKP